MRKTADGHLVMNRKEHDEVMERIIARLDGFISEHGLEHSVEESERGRRYKIHVPVMGEMLVTVWNFGANAYKGRVLVYSLPTRFPTSPAKWVTPFKMVCLPYNNLNGKCILHAFPENVEEGIIEGLEKVLVTVESCMRMEKEKDNISQ